MNDLIDMTSLHDYWQSIDAYERKRIRQKEDRMTELEERIYHSNISFNDILLYFPCRTYLPKTIEVDSYWHKINKKNKTLFVACKDRSYIDIASVIYEGLMGFPLIDIFKLQKRDRKTLYDLISNQTAYKNKDKTFIPGEGYK